MNRQFLRLKPLSPVSCPSDHSILREGFALTPMEIARPASHVREGREDEGQAPTMAVKSTASSLGGLIQPLRLEDQAIGPRRDDIGGCEQRSHPIASIIDAI